MTANELVVSQDLPASFAENLDGVPLFYLCCRKCAGLFCTEETFSCHKNNCSGDPYQCNTEYFACHREKFFSFYIDLWKSLKQNSDLLLHKDSGNDCEENVCFTVERHGTQCVSVSHQLDQTDTVQVEDSEKNNLFEVNDSGREESSFSEDVRSDISLGSHENNVENGIHDYTKKHSISKSNNQLPLDVASHDNDDVSFCHKVDDDRPSTESSEISSKNVSLSCEFVCSIYQENNNQIKNNREMLDGDETVYDMKFNNQSDCSSKEETDTTEMYSKLCVDGCDVYMCNLCSYQSKHLGFMQRHLSVHNTSSVFKCEICEFSCSVKSQFVAHSQSHREEILICDVCSATFKHRSTMKRHIDIKHKGESRYICNTCGYLAASNAGLTDHIRTHTGQLLKCDVAGCSFQTAYKRSLVLHQEKHNGIQRYVCEVCGYRTSESGSLQKHLSIHKGKKQFKCPHCSYRAVAHHDVVKHARTKHLRQKKYCCNKCNFSTGYPSSLANHLMAHAGVKPYKCSNCNYQSNMAAKVTRHIHQKHPLEQCDIVKLDIPFQFSVKDFVKQTDFPSSEIEVIRLSEEDLINEENEKSPDPDLQPDANPHLLSDLYPVPPHSDPHEDIHSSQDDSDPHPDDIRSPHTTSEESYLTNTGYQMSSFRSCSEEISSHLLDESDNTIFNHSDTAVFGSSAYKLLSQSTEDIRSDGMPRCVLKPSYRHSGFRRSSSVCSEPMLSSYRALSDADPDSCSMDATDDDVKDGVESSHLIGESDEVMHETRHLIGVSHGSIRSTDQLIGGSAGLTSYQCSSCLQLLTSDSSISQHQLICTGT